MTDRPDLMLDVLKEPGYEVNKRAMIIKDHRSFCSLLFDLFIPSRLFDLQMKVVADTQQQTQGNQHK